MPQFLLVLSCSISLHVCLFSGVLSFSLLAKSSGLLEIPRFAGSPYELCDIPRLCFKIHAFCWLNHSNPLICWLNSYFRCRNPTSSWSVWRTWSEVEGLRVLDRWETNTAARRGTHWISVADGSGWSGWPGWQGRGFL